jgi:hypothetical protein
MPELATALGTLIRQGGARLAEAGMPEPRREALRIWADLTRDQLFEALLAQDVDRRAVSGGDRTPFLGRAAQPRDWVGRVQAPLAQE